MLHSFCALQQKFYTFLQFGFHGLLKFCIPALKPHSFFFLFVFERLCFSSIQSVGLLDGAGVPDPLSKWGRGRPKCSATHSVTLSQRVLLETGMHLC